MALIKVLGAEKTEYDNFDPIRKSEMAEIQDGGQNHRKLPVFRQNRPKVDFSGVNR